MKNRSGHSTITRLSHAARALATIAILASSIATPADRLVCLRGMIEAGAACPLCHGSNAAAERPCCRWVENNAPTATAGSLSTGLGNPLTHSAPILLAELGPPTLEARTVPPLVGPRSAKPPDLSTTFLRL
jgi:hypothetical protein